MIGMEGEPSTGYPVTEHEIVRYCQAIDDLNALYVDPDYAYKSPYGGVIAPPLFYFIPFQSVQASLSNLRHDGIPARSGGGVPQPSLPLDRRMAGGVEVEFLQPVRPGDVLTARRRLADIYQRQGRSGPLIFIVNEATYTNQRGEVVCVERTSTIAR